MKILTIVGARPQFIKAAPFSTEVRRRHTEVLVHTGQHYDVNMSDIFFRELGVPEPDYHLDAGGGSHATQTAKIVAGVEAVIIKESPDLVLVYGDTNSTLAAALAAAKLHVSVAHVEAGLRSYNKCMPEEINRCLTDHASSVLLCPSKQAVGNLAREGIHRNVYDVGDIMLDVLRKSAPQIAASRVLQKERVVEGKYLLATVHRAENTDNIDNITALLKSFGETEVPILFPLHPRTKKVIHANGIKIPSNVKPIEPLGYFDLMCCLKHAHKVLTDSGGLQKEAYWVGTPCITLRGETEWVETLAGGWNTLVGVDSGRIADALRAPTPTRDREDVYGNGTTAAQCVTILERFLESHSA